MTGQDTDDRDARDGRVRELVADGYSLRAIALKIGRSPTNAARLVKALGLKVAKGKPARSGSIGFVAGRVARK